MAREIKFRGYNRKNKEWLYGFYVQNRGAHFVCPDEFAVNKSWDDYEIDPATLGQFTGLRDKNDKEIYEGDAVKFENRKTLPNVGVVTYWEDDCMFVCDSGVGVFELEKRYVTGEHLSEYKYNSYVVIGNILDNPEFLDKLL